MNIRYIVDLDLMGNEYYYSVIDEFGNNVTTFTSAVDARQFISVYDPKGSYKYTILEWKPISREYE